MKKKKSGSSEKNPTSKNSLLVAKDDKIIIYTDDKGNTELRADVKGETIWASQAQVAQLFDVNVRTVNEHLKNVFKSSELHQVSVIRNFRITAADGKQYLTKLYNLDAIIAVGYRVNSKKATQFRIWATSVLKDFIIKGFSLNRQMLTKSPEKIEGLQEAIDLIRATDNPGKLKGKITVKLTKNLEAE
jgi:hypothetical protein